MGIKDFNKFFRGTAAKVGYCPDAYQTISLKAFYRERIAVDVSCTMHVEWAVAQKEIMEASKIGLIRDGLDLELVFQSWLKRMCRNIHMYIQYGITPIIIFDGKAPIEKDLNARADRRATSDKAKVEIARLQGVFADMDDLEITSDMMKLFRREHAKVRYLTKSHQQTFKDVLYQLGIPVMQAISEAEELCSYLCRTGQVAAVCSLDSDNLVHGCTVLIRKIAGPLSNRTAEIVILRRILDKIQFTFDQFVDLCIMAGCDYNKNISGKAITRCYPFIRDYHSIDLLPSTLDVTCLDHIRCRELFRAKNNIEDICSGYTNYYVEKDKLLTARDGLMSYGLDEVVTSYMMHYAQLPNPTEYYINIPLNSANMNVIDVTGDTNNEDIDIEASLMSYIDTDIVMSTPVQYFDIEASLRSYNNTPDYFTNLQQNN